MPVVTASPSRCVSRSSSPRSTPACTRAVRASRSTLFPFIRDRSITMPPSQTEKPGKLCPPPRTATRRPCILAKRTADLTSATPGAARDQRGVSVDRSVPHLSVLLVAVVISTDELTVQRRSEFVDGALVQANVLGRGQNGHVRRLDPRDGRCQEPEFHPSPG